MTSASPPAVPAAATPQPAAPAPGATETPAENGETNPAFAATSLYVGDLDPSVSEAQLYEIFQQFGHVVSIRVCRDLITRRSLGYAYVNFNSVDDAKQAMEMLNYTPLNGKPMRIMLSQRDPSVRKSGVGNVFIKNLDKSIDLKELHDTFAQFGKIQSTKIAFDETGSSKGFGFVQFETQESADKAIEKVNGKQLRDKVVYVGRFLKRQDRQLEAEGKFTNVYVKNIPEEWGDEELKTKLSECGEVESAVVMKDDEGKSKGFGFCSFVDPEGAALAVDTFNDLDLSAGEKKLFCGRAQKKAERVQELRRNFELIKKDRIDKFAGANLYLKNIADTVNEEDLRSLFVEFGTIMSVKLMKDTVGVSRGVGFVAFSSPEEATRAVTEMNGKMIRGKPLYVALAQRKDERASRLKAQFAARGGMPAAGMQAGMPVYPGAPGVGGNQMYFPPQVGMPPGGPGIYPGIVPGVRPGPGMPQYFMPMVQGGGARQQGRRGMRNPMGGQVGRGGRGGMRGFPPNMQRGNVEQMGAPNVPVAPGEAPQQGTASLAAQLAQASPDQQRIIIGEALYPLVEAIEPAAAAKVTGMLLEMDQSEVLHLIEDQAALSAKIAEAMHVLRQAGQAPEQVTSAVADQVANLAVS